MVSIRLQYASKQRQSKKHIGLVLLTISTYISNRAGRTGVAAGSLSFATPITNPIQVKRADYLEIYV